MGFARALPILRLLKAVRAAMAPGARLIVIEEVLAAEVGAGDAGTYVNDLNMLVLFGGSERTMAGFNALMAAAGFGDVTRIAVRGGWRCLRRGGLIGLGDGVGGDGRGKTRMMGIKGCPILRLVS